MFPLLILCLFFQDPGKVLPSFVEADSPTFQEITFPASKETAPSLPADTRFLVIQLGAQEAEIQHGAYELKELITRLKADVNGLQVALQGTPHELDAFNQYEISGYVDAYAYTHEPYVPEADKTARLWRRTKPGPVSTLKTLLQAQSEGVALVVFEEPLPDKELLPVLKELNALAMGDLDQQPPMVGIDSQRAHFFLNPANGVRYLFLQPELNVTDRLSFPLAAAHEARLIYPENARFHFTQKRKFARLQLLDSSPYLIFEFTPKNYQAPEAVTVSSASAIDPYEIVAANQVFRKNANSNFLSMDAIQKIHVYPLSPNEGNFTWIERMIVRKGKATEYHDLDLLINGASYPKNKQREEYIIGPGRFNTTALDIDLDLSYSYTYLGAEVVRGQDCWKIGFQPKEDGRYTRGVAWIQKRDGAHIKMNVTQTRPEPPFDVFEYTSYFSWKSDGAQRFFVSDRAEGKVVVSFFGFSSQYRVKVEVNEIKFNRHDIDEVVSEAYASDLRIIRETGDGPRYMVKPNHRATRRRKAHTRAVDETSERVLIEPGAFSSEKALVVGASYDSHSEDVEPVLWFDYVNLDFLGKGYELYAGPGVVALSNPSIFDSNKAFTGFLLAAPGGEEREYRQGVAIDDSEMKVQFGGLGFSLATPIGKHFTVKGTYELGFNGFDRSSKTAENFVTPSDMWEHALQLDMDAHTRFFNVNGFYRQAQRSEWEAWGYDSSQVEGKRYNKAGLSMSGSYDFLKNQGVGYTVGLLSGSDLDRFSRYNLGEDANIPGFGDIFKFDDAAYFNLDYSTRLGSFLPLQLGLGGGRLRVPEGEDRDVDLLGLNVGALFHGPWKTDIGLNLGVGLYSSRKLDKDSYTISLTFHRRI